jgi:hypothetical protein
MGFVNRKRRNSNRAEVFAVLDLLVEMESTFSKKDTLIEFNGVPFIEQKRSMNGAQFHSGYSFIPSESATLWGTKHR